MSCGSNFPIFLKFDFKLPSPTKVGMKAMDNIANTINIQFD